MRSERNDAPPPHHADVEAGLCGGLFTGEIDARDLAPLRPEHCYLKAHERVLAVALELASEGAEVTAVTAGGRLRERGWLADVGGVPGLTSLLNDAVTPASLDEARRLVIHAWARRQALALGQRTAAHARVHGSDTPTLLAGLRGEVERLEAECNTAAKPTDLGSGFRADFIDVQDAAARRTALLPVRWGSVNAAMDGGLWPESLFVVGARPGCGKTALALDICVSSASTAPEDGGGAALFVSIELPASQVRQRLICATAGITRGEYKALGEMAVAKINEFVPWLSSLPLWVDDEARTIQTIRATVRRHARMAEARGIPLRVVAVDYVQLVKADGQKFASREQEIAYVSRQFMEMRKEFPRTTFLILAQLNRKSAGGGEPNDSDLRECGQLEQDADTILMLWIPDDTKPEEVAAKFAKNRNGDRHTRPTFRVVPSIGKIDEVTP